MKMRSVSLGAVVSAALATAVLGLSATGQQTRSEATAVQPGARVDNFRLVDQFSQSHELYYFKNSAAIVLVTHANGSPRARDAAVALDSLRASYAAKGAVFFLVNATDKADAVIAKARAAGLSLPVLLDDAQLVTEGLGATRAAEAFVIDPRTWKIVYHGPLDDRFEDAQPRPNATVSRAYVANAIDALLSGQPVKVASAKMDGDVLALPGRNVNSASESLSYAERVAPILARNCVACHSKGGIAPFAMDSYEAVKSFAPMIREAIRTDRMPPYQANPHVGAFKDDKNLSVADQKTLVHWIEAGAPRGNGPDPLLINAKPAPEWPLGKPDLVITLPAFTVPASGIVDYQNPVLRNPLTEGKWLRASTVKVGDRQAVHHLLSPVGGYAVGAESTVYADGTGVWVEAGQALRFQLHYTSYGREATDVTRLGLYFYDDKTPPSIIRRSAVIANPNIEIPPNTPRHEEVAYITFPHDALLYSVFPHAHYRGESVAVSLQRPGQGEELILALPKYDFNWQRGYEFAQPLSVPAGSRIISRYQYDNSANNRSNPDANIKVTWGEQSQEEMQYTSLHFRWVDETVSAPKPNYMTDINATRALGIMDTDLDGKVARTEVRGRMGQMIAANFDKLDLDKDGFLAGTELGPISTALNRRVAAAEAEQSVGR